MTNKSDQPVFGRRSIKNEDNIYEDDGFFSDVPATGSLSKSQRALNKYMKTNLLYENGEESDRNSDYFSKETSPNESVSKYDSESVLSDESFDKKQPFLSVSNSESRNSSFSPTNDFTAIQKNTVQDVQTMNVTLNNADKVIDVHTDTDKIHATKDNIDFIIEKHSDNYTTPTSNGVAEQNLSDDVKNAVRSNAPNILQERTENRKSLITENNRSKINPHLVSTNISEAQKNNSNTRRKLIYQSSDDMNIVKPKQIEQNASVVLRKNSIKTQAMDNRHTIHEFDNWGNRTTIYPDVYAPLPYKSPRRYVEGDVNIHYRCPVRRAPLPLVPERELARQQADHMKRLYREQRRAKYLQELQDMQNRRHQDNFTPAQKNILPLNRYDEADRTAARALYAFNGQTPRELSFKKGDFINVRRQIDSNWYEGELHGRIGLFPYNYLEILKGDVAQSAKKPPAQEGKARAKFDFTAQTSLELPLKKGEVVVLTRRIDHNWWEGRTGNKTGIFPDSYVQVLQEPSQNKPDPQLNSDKPLASPASHGQVAGAARRSMGSHSYTPQLNSPALANAPPATQPLPARPAQSALTPSDRGYGPPPGVDLNNTEPLYVDTNAEAVPYRAMYKYRPQNPDELELREGDTVYVLEQCDDGWYVGSSQRSGRLGTFPGNYVERI